MGGVGYRVKVIPSFISIELSSYKSVFMLMAVGLFAFFISLLKTFVARLRKTASENLRHRTLRVTSPLIC